MWKAEDGKGVDDFMVNNGSGAFESACQTAITKLEKQFRKTGITSSEKLPRVDDMVDQLAEEYRDQLKFDNEAGNWMRYEADYPGMWSAETDDYFDSIIDQILKAKGVKGITPSYISNIVKLLKGRAIERRWNEISPKDLLPFRNGVLEIATGKLLPHSPGYRFTWQLPREHNLDATDWLSIDAYLDHLSQGNAAIKDLLLCYCNAVLKGRSDLQKFMHLIGVGGSGKGTFARLLTDLIGEENIYSATLEEWCGNRFESANAYRKRLVVFWDEDKQTGKLGKFLSLTGGDWIRAEEKNKKAFQYRYDGMALVLSNLPIFTGDAASRVKRRIITVPCNAAVPTGQRRDLNTEFQPELAAFTNYVLSLEDSHVTRVLSGLAEIPECSLEFWENRVRVDSVAAWLNQHVIYDVTAQARIGCDRNEGIDGMPINTLFGSYNKHCRATGDQAKSHKNFSPDLLEICRSVLGWEVERHVTKTGKIIRGLRLRIDGDDDHLPTHDYALMQLVTVGDGSVDGSQCLQDKDFEKGDGLILTSLEKEKNLNLEIEVKNKKSGECVELLPSPTPKPIQDRHSETSPASITATVTNALAPTNHSPLPYAKGEKVEFYYDGDCQWRKGRVIAVHQEQGYLVKVDIEYWAWGKTRCASIHREDWVRKC